MTSSFSLIMASAVVLALHFQVIYSVSNFVCAWPLMIDPLTPSISTTPVVTLLVVLVQNPPPPPTYNLIPLLLAHPPLA